MIKAEGGRNYRFQVLEKMFKTVTRKTIKNWIQNLNEEEQRELEKLGIKLVIKKIPFSHPKNDCSSLISTLDYVYIDPPGGLVEGHWQLFPILLTVVEDAVTLALRGELIERWDSRPRIPRRIYS